MGTMKRWIGLKSNIEQIRRELLGNNAAIGRIRRLIEEGDNQKIERELELIEQTNFGIISTYLEG